MSLFGPAYDQSARQWEEPPDDPVEITDAELYRRHTEHHECQCHLCKTYRAKVAKEAQEEYFAHQSDGPCDCESCRCYLESLR